MEKFSIPEGWSRYKDIKVFQSDEELIQEEIKPPVPIGNMVKFSEDEKSILSLGPKLAIRRILNKEDFMEKALIKEKYNCLNEASNLDDDDGEKEEENRSKESEDEEARIERLSKIEEAKSRQIFQKDGKNMQMDFGRLRATDMKQNKRIFLTKPMDGG